MLAVNFRKVGQAEKRIRKGQFAIQDSSTSRDINLQDDWETCFLPGQRVDMSIILLRHSEASVCPKCHATCEGNSEDDCEW